jgi:hypothetical protein
MRGRDRDGVVVRLGQLVACREKNESSVERPARSVRVVGASDGPGKA